MAITASTPAATDASASMPAPQERAELMERERLALAANAALEERQKLVRDLHDSVSQALYGISLGTQTAMEALAMRALIFELRPESLEQEGLVAALERNAAVARARYGLSVTLELEAEPELRGRGGRPGDRRRWCRLRS